MHPVLLDLGSLEIGGASRPLRIGSYGALLVAAIACGWWVTVRLGSERRTGVAWLEILTPMVATALLGGKLYAVAFGLPDLLAGSARWGDLLASSGSFLPGALLALALGVVLAHRRGLPPGTLADALAPAASLGTAIARLGCLAAGCCHGRPTDLPWAIVYDHPLAHELFGTPLGVPVHPAPVYESLLALGNFALLMQMARRRPPAWTVFAAWATLYGGQRFLLEFLRAASDQVGPLTANQWICLGLVAAGTTRLAVLARRDRALARREA